MHIHPEQQPQHGVPEDFQPGPPEDSEHNPPEDLWPNTPPPSSWKKWCSHHHHAEKTLLVSESDCFSHAQPEHFDFGPTTAKLTGSETHCFVAVPLDPVLLVVPSSETANHDAPLSDCFVFPPVLSTEVSGVAHSIFQ